MTGVAIGINASGGSPAYSAAQWRQAMALGLMYGGRNMGAQQGVRPGGNQLQVSLAGSTITVQPGVCVLDPALSTPQGPYWVAIPVAETHTLTAADATNPRKDIVICRVYDHDEDASGLRLPRTEYLPGTPNASPAEPAVPAGAIRLATIDVPQVGGGSPVVTDRRPWTVAPGGILPVAASGDIAAGVAGRYRHRLDTGQLEQDTGSAWRRADWSAAWGRVAGKKYTGAVLVAASPGTESGANMNTGSASLKAGRSYMIRAAVRAKLGSGNTDLIWRIREGASGTSGTQRGFKRQPFPNNTEIYETEVFGFYDCTTDETKTFCVTSQSGLGTGTVDVWEGSAGIPVFVEVIDVGPTALVEG